MNDFEAAVDAPAEGQVVSGLTMVSGWALFDAAPAAHAIVRVAERTVGSLATGGARPDVGAVFDRPWAAASGFAGVVDLAAVPPGHARLSIAVTAAGGTERRVERAVTVTAEPAVGTAGTDAFDSMLLAWLNTPLSGTGPPWYTRGALQLQLGLSRDLRLPHDAATTADGFLLWLFAQHDRGGDAAIPAGLIEGVFRAPAERRHHALPELWRETDWGRRMLCWLNDDAGIASMGIAALSRFGYIVRDLREDLGARYADALHAGRSSFAAWVSEHVGDPVINPWCRIPATSPAARGWVAPGAAEHEDSRTPVFREFTFSAGSSLADIRGSNTRVRLPDGVNVVGHFREPSGLTEATRSTARAAQRAALPFGILETGPTGRAGVGDGWSALEQGYAYDASVLHDNVAHAPSLLRRVGLRYLLQRHIVGFWYWELADVPETYEAALDYVDEIWTASTFTAEALRARARVPVTVVPPVLDVDGLIAAPLYRHAAIPRDRFVFLAMASVHSGVARKNPRGVVEAFERAFGGDALRHVALVLKITGLELVPDLAAFIDDAARRLPIVVITEPMTHAGTLGLIASTDALVSLHRGEGFGLPLAEAMALGRPVVATAYAGNMDFTTEDTAFLVDYDLVPLNVDEGPYRAGQMWAEPRLDRAAERMREVLTDRSRRLEVAQHGRELILERCDGRRTAGIVAQRLAAGR